MKHFLAYDSMLLSFRDRLRLQQWHIGFLVIPLALPALWPFYSEGLPRSFDGGLHLLRIGILDRHIRAGMLYPRWSPESLLGYGYPLFSFYAPASYYLAELFVLLGLSYYAAFVAAFLVVVLATGFGMYALALDIFGARNRGSALVAAVAYIYAPYLLTNIYIRGAIAESAAQALLPWILWSARRIFSTDRPFRYFLILATLLGLLALTHNITLLFLPPVLVLYMLLHWWQTGRSYTAAGWAVSALVAAMALSAFFWLPLVFERRYLAGTAFEISRTVWLPSSMWTRSNFLDTGLTFNHTFARPIRLGVVQLVLALSGFVLARRRDPEWLFFLLISLLAGAAIGSWALPIWLNFEILSIAQFAWRLLSVLSLFLALLAGGIPLFHSSPVYRSAATAVTIALIILTQQPRLAWMDVFAPETVNVSAPVLAQTEVEKGALVGGEGNSSIQEFRPRWAGRTLTLEPSHETIENPVEIDLNAANLFSLSAAITASVPGSLRFTNFYYPGWNIVLDGKTQASPYPTTNLGLLTVDVPAGTHQLELLWTGTALQHMAAVISVLAVLALGLLSLRARFWPPAVASATLLILVLVGASWRMPQQPVQPPIVPVHAEGLKLLGYRVHQKPARELNLYPYWLVTNSAPEDMHLQWQMLDSNGHIQAESIGSPYFNSYPTSNWPAGTIVDDAYHMRLPDGLDAGKYKLTLQMDASSGRQFLSPTIVGEIVVQENIAEDPDRFVETDAVFGDVARLTGFTLLNPDLTTPPASERPAPVSPGDYVRYQLDWQATAPVEHNYHAFIHLVDGNGLPLVQEDQLPGPLFQPPRIWDRLNRWPDVYLLRIPSDAPSGLYWPAVGMYEFETLKRLPVQVGNAEIRTDDFRLPPLKIVSAPGTKPMQSLSYHFGDQFTLTGYDVQMPVEGLQAGDQFEVTLYFRSEKETGEDYVRFLQLYSPDIGVIAQNDGPPQSGGNPTWSWVPGEVIRDSVILTVDMNAPPGIYTLYTGLYSPAAGNTRLPVTGADGQQLPDAWIPVAALTVEPKRP